MINHYLVQRSTANRDNVAAQLMHDKVNTLAIDNQASHFASNFTVALRNHFLLRLEQRSSG
jgi:hypothetical protein